MDDMIHTLACLLHHLTGVLENAVSPHGDDVLKTNRQLFHGNQILATNLVNHIQRNFVDTWKVTEMQLFFILRIQKISEHSIHKILF